MRQKTILIASLLAVASFTFGVAPESARCQWVKTNLPNAWALAANGSTLYAGTDSGMVRSTDDGTTWTDITNGLPPDVFYVILTNGTDIFVGTAPSYASSLDFSDVYRSTDNGASWTKPSLKQDADVNSLIMSGTNLIAGLDGAGRPGKGGVFLSTNGGTSWTAVNNGLSGNRVYSLTVIGSSVFAGTEKALNLSTDNGANWTQLGPTTLHNISSFAQAGGSLFAGTLAHGIYRSRDNGTTWNPSTTGPLATTWMWDGGIAASGTKLFATFYDASSGSPTGVYFSGDTGTTWSAANTGLPKDGANGAYRPTVQGSNLFVLDGGGGVWRRPLSEFGAAGVSQPSAQPSAIELAPNPTNGIVTVRSAEEGILRVTISNILGQRVMEIDPSHSLPLARGGLGRGADFSIDLSNLPSGSYFARFASAGSVTTKIIVKD